MHPNAWELCTTELIYRIQTDPNRSLLDAQKFGRLQIKFLDIQESHALLTVGADLYLN